MYHSTDVRLQRDVALKVSAYPDAGSQRFARFLQEARLTASLDHPNVIRLFDVGLFEGRPYLVAELLDGETLRDASHAAPSSRMTHVALQKKSPPGWSWRTVRIWSTGI